MRIAINGAGVAGPALAFWLRRGGHEVTLIEQAESLRAGGYIVDFWGVGYTVAERMGLLPQVLDAGYRVEAVRMVDEAGRKVAGFSADVFRRAVGERFTSLARGDLASIIFRSIEAETEVLFGDAIDGLEQHDAGVRATLASGGEREFDLVAGADGQHSAIRELVFGSEARFEAALGYYVAACEVEGYRPRDELTYLTYAMPGREVARFAMRGDRTLFLFVFAAEQLDGEAPGDPRAVLRRVFGGQGWETPQILDAVDVAGDVYFDRMSQIALPHWSKGRVVLLGDAASCVSLLAGEGAGLAMTQAYVLGAELAAAGADHVRAFQRYEQRLQPFLAAKQKSARRFAAYFAPKTKLGVWVRNQAANILDLPVIGQALAARDLRDDFELPDYGD